jgi:predicted ATPase
VQSSRGLFEPTEGIRGKPRVSSVDAILHELLADNENIQFLIATHSPILLAYPGAQILSFDGGTIHPISYQDSQPFQLVSRFLAAPERYMNALFSKPAETDS